MPRQLGLCRVGSACTVYQAAGTKQLVPSSGLTLILILTLTLTLTRYKLSVPARYDGNVSWPLLVGFHGLGLGLGLGLGHRVRVPNPNRTRCTWPIGSTTRCTASPAG